MPSDRQVLVSFLRSIDADDVIALPPSRGRATQSAGHEDALEAAAERFLRIAAFQPAGTDAVRNIR